MKETLEFFDVKTKSKFKSSDWRIEKKESASGRTTYFAVTSSPSGPHEVYKIVSKVFAQANS